MTKVTSNIPPLLGVILAGGRASRMGGRDKFLIKIGGKPVIDHIRRAISPHVDKLILNSNVQHQIDLKIISDLTIADVSIGPMGGLYTALRYAKQHQYQKLITVPGDTPFIPDNFVARLVEKNEDPIAIACSQGRRHPLCGLWDVSVIDDLSSRIEKGNYKMMDWLDQQNVTEIHWDDHPDPFFNINTESDLERAKQLYLTR